VAIKQFLKGLFSDQAETSKNKEKHNLSVQLTARAKPFFQNIEELKIHHFYRS